MAIRSFVIRAQVRAHHIVPLHVSCLDRETFDLAGAEAKVRELARRSDIVAIEVVRGVGVVYRAERSAAGVWSALALGVWSRASLLPMRHHPGLQACACCGRRPREHDYGATPEGTDCPGFEPAKGVYHHWVYEA